MVGAERKKILKFEILQGHMDSCLASEENRKQSLQILVGETQFPE
jgi:hypothetical protein